ncbi:hypothetical protein SAMN04488132_10830 [Sediminibacterium ginsengisoli]|uniref:Uncharacterized protein n=1 Tax=Sediminibacterium ginsengisoli TaxID=413434 RepID=A0A1T4QBI2_9BACT|nr:hypothetical protein SAMN04488132_10830 [Sediminibacterium ginsengisoli]
MSNKKGLSLPFLIIAIVIGSAIYREFNFETYRFEKPALAVVYILTFVMCVYFMVRGRK